MSLSSLSLDPSAAQSDALPPLRQDLQIFQTGKDHAGVPRVTLYDPVAHKYFDLPPAAVALLKRWSLGSIKRVQAVMAKAGELVPEDSDIEGFVKFGKQHGLFQGTTAQDIVAKADLLAQHKKWIRQGSAAVFFKIPLLRPERFMGFITGVLSPLARPWFFWLTAVALLISAMILVPQLGIVETYVRRLVSLQGAVGAIVAMVCLKVIHEFGHAYFASNYGVRVPRMGVTLIMGFPLPYTELVDTWRLGSRRGRILIDLGGIIFESVVAAWAIVFFAILPDGPMRAACFNIGFVSLFTTLLFNLNPLMKFDGYYLLSDILRLPNVHQRALAFSKRALRRWAVGLRSPVPEVLPLKYQRVLTILGFSLMIYRVFLYLGLSAGAFALLPKSLAFGVAGFMITAFLIAPVVEELAFYWSKKEEIMSRAPVYFWIVCLGALGAWAAIPQTRVIEAPAVIRPAERMHVVAPQAADVDVPPMTQNTPVKVGDVLVVLRDHVLEQELARAELELARLRTQVGRGATAATQLQNTQVIERQIEETVQRIADLNAQSEALTLRAEASGLFVPATRDAHVWLRSSVSQGASFGDVVAQETWRVTGYIKAQDELELAEQESVVFQFQDPFLSPVDAQLSDISGAFVERLEVPELSMSNGGPIETRVDDRAVPVEAWIKIEAIALDVPQGFVGGVGQLRLTTQPQAPWARMRDHLRMLILREGGI